MSIEDYNLNNYKSFQRISKIIKDNHPHLITEREACFYHGEHHDMYDMAYAVYADSEEDQRIILDEYENKVRVQLLKENLKLFHIIKEEGILKLRQKNLEEQVNKGVYAVGREKEGVEAMISLYKKDKDQFYRLYWTTSTTIRILEKELRAIREMKGVSFEEEDRRRRQIKGEANLNEWATTEYFKSEGFDGDI